MKLFRFPALAVCSFALLAFLGSGSALVSCSDDTQESVKKTDGTEQTDSLDSLTPDPVTDQLEVKFNSPAVVFGADRSGFNANVVNRMTNTTSEITPSVKAFVFTKNHNVRFSVDDVTKMFQAYQNGANFILVDPASVDRTALIDTIQAAIDTVSKQGTDVTEPSQMLARFKQVKQMSTQSVDNRTEAVAFSQLGLYIVRNLEETADSARSNAMIQGLTADSDTVNTMCAPREYAPTEYDHGKSADQLVQWMNRAVNFKNQSTANAVTDADGNVIKPQSVCIQQTLGPTLALEKKMRYEINVDCYSFHDCQANEDHYLVHISPTYHNSQLECPNITRRYHNFKDVITYSNFWYKIDQWVKLADGTLLRPSYLEGASTGVDFLMTWRNVWYGPYFKGCYLSCKLTDANGNNENISMPQISPSEMVQGTVKSGLNTEINNVSMLYGNLWGGKWGQTVKAAQSFEHHDGGLFGANTGRTGSFTDWTFGGERPGYIYVDHQHDIKTSSVRGVTATPYYGADHSIVEDFQRNDWSTDLTLHYVVKNPKVNSMYTLTLNDIAYAAELVYRDGDETCSARYDEGVVWNEHTTNIPLFTPVRSDEYQITCSDPNFMKVHEQHIKDAIKEFYTTDWSGNYPNFTVYGTSEEEMQGRARNAFYKFAQIIRIVAYRYDLSNYTIFHLRKGGVSKDILMFILRDDKEIQ